MLYFTFEQEVLNLATTEMHETAARVFLQVLEDKLVPVEYFVSTFLQSILMGVDNRDQGTHIIV